MFLSLVALFGIASVALLLFSVCLLVHYLRRINQLQTNSRGDLGIAQTKAAEIDQNLIEQITDVNVEVLAAVDEWQTARRTLIEAGNWDWKVKDLEEKFRDSCRRKISEIKREGLFRLALGVITIGAVASATGIGIYGFKSQANPSLKIESNWDSFNTSNANNG